MYCLCWCWLLFFNGSSRDVNTTENGSNKSKNSGVESMTEEEGRLLESLGILHLLEEPTINTEAKSSTSTSSPHSLHPPVSKNIPTPASEPSSQSTSSQPLSAQPTLPNNSLPPSIWTKIRNVFKRSKKLPSQTEADAAEVALAKNAALNITQSAPQMISQYTPASLSQRSNNYSLTTASFDNPKLNKHDDTAINNDDSSSISQYKPILLGIGGTLFLLPHLAILLSLPPVLQRRGAPYLPTFANKLTVMFDLIKSQTAAMNRAHQGAAIQQHHRALHAKEQQQQSKMGKFRFADIGSGDGRVVFRAAREGIFDLSVGYEINPSKSLTCLLCHLYHFMISWYQYYCSFSFVRN